jgi:hypothetical protein
MTEFDISEKLRLDFEMLLNVWRESDRKCNKSDPCKQE